MDPVRCRPGSFVSERLLTAGGEMAGTSPRDGPLPPPQKISIAVAMTGGTPSP